MSLLIRLLFIACLLGGELRLLAAGCQPVALRCEYLVNPLGLDETHPRFTWCLEATVRGAKQSCYRLLVASRPELLAQNVGDMWDTRQVFTNATVNIPYAGQPLMSRQVCFWKVGVWDEDGNSAWSEPARWTMGLLQPEDWHADYITFTNPAPIWKDASNLFLPPAHQFRKTFTAAKTIHRATVYATALGIYELYVNGRRVGDARFAPGWTDYHQRAYYNTYDVTRLVTRGDNVLGIWLADGWYSGYLGFGLLTGIGTEKIGRYTYGKTPAVMVQLEIEYSDGSRAVIPTDRAWKVTDRGPIQQADLLMGEYYDARQELDGWSRPGFNDAYWSPALLAGENGPAPATFYQYENPDRPDAGPEINGHPVDLGFHRPAKLEAFPGLPVRPIQEIKTQALSSPAKGVYIFNLGQNFAGVVRLKVRGPAGTVVQLRYGEQLHTDGTLMNENLRKARATDYYVLRGDPLGETYQPRFTFHGFQYVEVKGYPGEPGKDVITGIVLHSDTPMTSDFQCSDPRANRLFQNIVWTQRANFLELPTDCPQRDERFGWMGDAQIYVHCATLNADVAAFYSKWLREVMEAQRPSGVFPGYSPFPFQHGRDFGTAWCDAGVICPWTIWQAYHDNRIIERCWPGMVKFMDWRQTTSSNYLGVVHGNDWGDWLSFGPKTPLDYVDTVYFAYSAHLMSQMAAAIGKPAEAARYAEWFDHIKAAFIATYVYPDGSLAVDTQTAYALALYMDLIPAEVRGLTGKILAQKLRAGETADNSGMTTGFLGTRPLLPVLTSVGENDLAVKQFQSDKFPSWGYEVAQGATTVWEHWDSFTKAHGFGGMDGKQNAAMNSFAHYSFGAVGEWMIGDLAGIQAAVPGYDQIIIHPHPPTPGGNGPHDPIQWVTARYDSIHGRITSQWHLQGPAFTLITDIPANTTAQVYLPTGEAGKITESGKPLAQVAEVLLVRSGGGSVVLGIGSGHYEFTCPFKPVKTN